MIDLTSGVRRKVLTKVRDYFGADPTGKRLSWFDDHDYWTVDVASSARTNLTASLTGGQHVDFVDRDDDHPTNVLPSIGSPTWSKDGGRTRRRFVETGVPSPVWQAHQTDWLRGARHRSRRETSTARRRRRRSSYESRQR